MTSTFIMELNINKPRGYAISLKSVKGNEKALVLRLGLCDLLITFSLFLAGIFKYLFALRTCQIF